MHSTCTHAGVLSGLCQEQRQEPNGLWPWGWKEESQLHLKSRGGACGGCQAGAVRHPAPVHPQGGYGAEVVGGREELRLAGCTPGQQHCSARSENAHNEWKAEQDTGPNHLHLGTMVMEMTKEKAACELELKANPETTRVRPIERREAGGVHH